MSQNTLDELVSCCKRVDPCEAVCLLENVHLDLLMGKGLRSYQIGGENFTLFQPSLPGLLGSIQYFKKLCEDCRAGGDGITRRRANNIFVHSEGRVKTRRWGNCS